MKMNKRIFLCALGSSLAFTAAAQTSEEVKKTEEESTSDDDIKPIAAYSHADFTWLNGNSRQTEYPLQYKAFTGEINIDSNYVHSFARPKDHTLIGSTNTGRTNEFQLQQIGFGGNFYHKRVRARLMTQFGMYSTMQPRNDASPSRGQWNTSDAYKYFSEAYAGYQITEKLNIDAGIFMSYIGLFSFYNYENWAYQPSYVSANTPFFFNGLRIQYFPSVKTKIEGWIVNGWQSYGMYNEAPGLGVSIIHRPNGNLSFVTNNYFGADTMGRPGRTRGHTDNSVQYKYFDRPADAITKAAFSLTVDFGCEDGGGVSCNGGGGKPSQYFGGFMLYNRVWFNKNRHAITLGGGAINNPGRYLVLLPPVNGATATSGTPSFTQNAGDTFNAWDGSVTFDYLPSEFITFRLEFNHREANVPYFADKGGITPPGGNTGASGSAVADFQPDLTRVENRATLAMMIRL